MQPLVRVVPRLFIDPPAFSAAPRAIRISNRRSIRPSICLQCRLRNQIRPYADTPKSPVGAPSPPDPAQAPGASSGPFRPEPEKTPESSLPDNVLPDLPSAAESRRSAINKRLSHLMDHLQGNIFIASQRINDLTGYSGIEALKTRITALETKLAEAQEAVRSSRLVYKTTVADRASTQREVTTLLARKDTWTPQDLERFTALYRMDHSNEQAVQEAATRLADAEREAETAASKLSSSILSRYHEEQIWSDKIRRMSTWGTWGLMGVNVLLFLVFQFGFEPWRRRRLVKGFEDKVREALENEKLEQLGKNDVSSEEEAGFDGMFAAATGPDHQKDGMSSGVQSPEAVIQTVATGIEQEGQAAFNATETDLATIKDGIKQSETWDVAVEAWKSAATDLFSDRLVQLRKQDVTIIALEGAATGATLVAIIATLLFRHS